MSKLMGLACGFMVLFLAMKPQSEQFPKYKAIAAYEIRPGILMMPRYSADRQICELGLEKLHYSSEMVRLDSSLSREEIDHIFEELVPTNERGPRVKNFERDLITQTGPSLITTSEYENVSMQIYSEALPASHKAEIVERDVVAVVRWKNRKCQSAH